jgi:SPP1 gp7 family putative phage head morphogenesis protein
MRELNRWENELERLMNASYSTVDSELFKAYKSGLKEIKAQLADYVARYETLSFSKRLEVERLFGVAAEMDGILQGVFDNTKNAIADYERAAADIGYNGVWYALEGAENIQMNLPQLDQAFVEAAINQPVAGKTLSQRLYQDRKQLAKETQSAIINGLLQGQGYSSIAGQINNITEASYKQALRIARTEAGRMRSQAALKSYDAAREAGVDLRLSWMSTLDTKTRKDHQALDGQVADEEGLFWTGGMTGAGYSGKAPRMFGVAKEDINCRCTTVAVVDGVAPELRRDNMTGETIPYKSYAVWEEEKKKQYGEDEWAIEGKKYSNKKADQKQYDEYLKLLGTSRVGTFETFQDAKYRKNAEWTQIQDNRFVVTRLTDGRYGSIINPEKQTAHNFATHTKGRSYLLENVDAQQLFNRYAGYGRIQPARTTGRRTNKEMCIADRVIGFAVSGDIERETRAFKIHHSGDRTHIVPMMEGKSNEN